MEKASLLILQLFATFPRVHPEFAVCNEVGEKLGTRGKGFKKNELGKSKGEAATQRTSFPRLDANEVGKKSWKSGIGRANSGKRLKIGEVGVCSNGSKSGFRFFLSSFPVEHAHRTPVGTVSISWVNCDQSRNLVVC